MKTKRIIALVLCILTLFALAGCNDYSEIESKISSAEDNIAKLEVRVKELEGLKTETEAYKAQIEALSKEIDDLRKDLEELKNSGTGSNGNADSSQASQAQTENSDSEQLNALSARLDSVEKALKELQESLVEDKIQSVIWYPKTSIYYVEYKNGAELNYLVSPAVCAADVKAAWEKDENAIKVNVLYASESESQSLTGVGELAVSSVSVASNGVLTLKVKENPSKPLTAGFKSGDIMASIYITVKYGDVEISSPIIDFICFA